MTALLGILGAASLLLWGLRMVRTGMFRAFGSRLNGYLARVTGNRFAAFLCGFCTTLVLQSSTATALTTSDFAARGMLRPKIALAIMLGADVATSIVAQAYALHIGWLAPLLTLVGYATFSYAREATLRDIGRATIGLGVALLGLSLISVAAGPLRNAQALPTILGLMSDAPACVVLVGALLTVLSTSSLAVMLLIVSFTTHHIVPLDLAYALVLGANLGSGITPMLATLGSAPEVRRVPLGNFIFRLAGIGICLPVLPVIMTGIAAIQAEGWRQMLNFHVAFNVGIAALFIGLIDPVARLTAGVLPAAVRPSDPAKPRYLTPRADNDLSIGLANASKEALRMGDILGRMLGLSMQAILGDDRRLADQVSVLDTQIDRLNEAIKLYLTEVSRDVSDNADQRRIAELVGFTTSLEHAADIADRGLAKLAAKKIKHRLRFSPEGSSEIEAIHRRLNANVELAMNVFLTSNLSLARRLYTEKRAFRELEREAASNHLQRLREGRIESVATSGLHLDVLRDLKRINSHLTLVAQARLEDAGELYPSRLKVV